MAATATVDNTLGTFVLGDRRAVIANIDFDASYPTGGESVTPAQFGFVTRIDFLIAEPKGGYTFVYDRANSKLLAYTTGAAHTHTENTAAAYTQNATTGASTAAAGSEVANTTNLSTLTGVRVLAIGV